MKLSSGSLLSLGTVAVFLVVWYVVGWKVLYGLFGPGEITEFWFLFVFVTTIGLTAYGLHVRRDTGGSKEEEEENPNPFVIPPLGSEPGPVYSSSKEDPPEKVELSEKMIPVEIQGTIEGLAIIPLSSFKNLKIKIVSVKEEREPQTQHITPPPIEE